MQLINSDVERGTWDERKSEELQEESGKGFDKASNKA